MRWDFLQEKFFFFSFPWWVSLGFQFEGDKIVKVIARCVLFLRGFEFGAFYDNSVVVGFFCFILSWYTLTARFVRQIIPCAYADDTRWAQMHINI